MASASVACINCRYCPCQCCTQDYFLESPLVLSPERCQHPLQCTQGFGQIINTKGSYRYSYNRPLPHSFAFLQLKALGACGLPFTARYRLDNVAAYFKGVPPASLSYSDAGAPASIPSTLPYASGVFSFGEAGGSSWCDLTDLEAISTSFTAPPYAALCTPMSFSGEPNLSPYTWPC